MTFMPPYPWLAERFYLDDAGALRHRCDSKNGKVKAGSVVGRKTRDGYWKIDVTHEGQRKKLCVHRVVWSLDKMRAVADGVQVDHRDVNRDNNTADNLRVFRSQRKNMLNRSIKGTGVKMTRTPGKFRSQISVHGRTICLGTYDCEKKAGRAYQLALKGRHPKVTPLMLKGQFA